MNIGIHGKQRPNLDSVLDYLKMRSAQNFERLERPKDMPLVAINTPLCE